MTSSTIPPALLPGARLPNGATVIAAERIPRTGEPRFIVLAVWHNGQEYVTWESNETGSTYWGHYQSVHGSDPDDRLYALSAAVCEYEERLKERGVI